MPLSITDDTVTHKDLAQLLGVSETTIKNYRSKFSEFFEVRGKGKPLRFASAVSIVCRDIRNCVREGLSVEETRARLRESHPQMLRSRSRRRDSGASTAHSQIPPELINLIPSLAGKLERLAALQDETNQRLERLEVLLAERLSGGLEEGSTLEEVRSMLAAWRVGQEEDRAGQGRSGTGGRLVRVRNAYGEVQEYHLESAPVSTPISVPVSTPTFVPAGKKKMEEAPGAAPGPPAEFLDMPLVVRSGRGEYLGVGGRGAGPFSTADLMGLMVGRFTAPNAFSFRWEAAQHAGDVGGVEQRGWLLQATQGRGSEAKVYRLDLERARTPRGNDVVLVWSLEVDGKEVFPVFLHNFIKQMMDMAAIREGES